ncbi:MAG TPA: outer membrane beta-barrel protein [Hanamia sp.]|nr:outer membrane beta-barrel protein [Hanamia sp.]
MNENLHNIDKLFKNAIEKLEEEPSSKVWEDIDKNLDKKSVVSISKKYHKLKLVASFLLIFSLGMAMYILQLNKKNKVQLKKNYDQITLMDKRGRLKNGAEKESGIAGNNKSSMQNKIPDTKEKLNKQLSQTLSKITEKKETELLKTESESLNINPKEKNTNTAGTLVNDNNKVGKFNNGKINKTGKIISQNNVQKLNIDNLSESTEVLNAHTLAIPLSSPDSMLSKKVSLNTSNITYSKSPIYTGAKNRILKPLHESPFYATVFFSPDIVSYKIKSDHPQFEEDAKSEIKKNEKPQFANSFGILVGYKLNKKWLIQSGMMISNRVISINSKTIYALPDRNGNINYRLSCFTGPSYIPLKSGTHPAPGDSATLSAKNTLQYINIPIVLQYRIVEGRLSINPGVGIATNFLVVNKIESVINMVNGNQSSRVNSSGLRSVYFNTFINLNTSYKISNRIAFSFTPVARFGLSSINKDAPVKTMLNSFGFGAGLNIEL